MTRTTTRQVKIADLIVDPTVNKRPKRKAKIAKIAQHFDPAGLGVIEVSERSDGTLVVLDGQHRIEAAKLYGWNNGQSVTARVHRGLSFADECRLFKMLNDETPVPNIHKLMAGADAEEHPDRAIRDIVESVGLKLSDQVADGNVVAAAALRNVWGGARKHGTTDNPELLRSTLRLLLGAWGPQSAAFRGEMIEGFGLFLARYGDNPDLDLDALTAALAQTKGGPAGFRGKAASLGDVMGTGVRIGIAGLIVQTYNKKRRSSKLDAWWS